MLGRLARQEGSHGQDGSCYSGSSTMLPLTNFVEARRGELAHLQANRADPAANKFVVSAYLAFVALFAKGIRHDYSYQSRAASSQECEKPLVTASCRPRLAHAV